MADRVRVSFDIIRQTFVNLKIEDDRNFLAAVAAGYQTSTTDPDSGQVRYSETGELDLHIIGAVEADGLTTLDYTAVPRAVTGHQPLTWVPLGKHA